MRSRSTTIQQIIAVAPVPEKTAMHLKNAVTSICPAPKNPPNKHRTGNRTQEKQYVKESSYRSSIDHLHCGLLCAPRSSRDPTGPLWSMQNRESD